MSHMIVVPDGETIAPRVKAVSELRIAADPLDFKLLRPETDVHTPHFERSAVRPLREADGGRRVSKLLHVPAGNWRPRMGSVNPVIEPVNGIVEPELRIARCKTRHDNPAHIGAPVAGGVLQVKQIGSAGDQYAVAP